MRCMEKDLTQLELEDALNRAERARSALLTAVRGLPKGHFLEERSDEWSPGQILRHLAWTEHYWTLLLRHVVAVGQLLVIVNDETSQQIAVNASRLAGTPSYEVSEIPPYATVAEALIGIDQSRKEFLRALQALRSADFGKRMKNRRGVVPLRFLTEHVIQHDWDHAVQITAVAAADLYRNPSAERRSR